MNRFSSLCFAALVSGCASGIDMLGFEPTCIPEIHARVVVSADIDNEAGASVVLMAASKTPDTSVTGIDHQGVPLGAGALGVVAVGDGARDQSFTAAGSPYNTWFVAFLDLDGDRRLSVGEPMGIDPRNPHPGSCQPFNVAIEIGHLRTL